ncbi:hypothetical protein DUI87_16485 [Hirundo rustica rustica]|uniref:Uncharacterized protein n=1 Tax=Hirundo rustica rustica TaxID=333673 RepID=A0A3M0K1B5_HIRRU|nr:hypothetical protein DUI87_16485 [Hirundo rustica rustica]
MEEQGLFSLVTSDRTQGNGMNLGQERFRLDIRRRFFIWRMAGHWNRFLREVVTTPSLTELEKCLDNVFKLLGYSCPGPGIGLDVPDGSFQLSIIYDSMFP